MKILILTATFATFLLHAISACAAEPLPSPYKVRFGTLEINDDAKRRYVFRSGESEEVFDLSSESILRSSATKFPGLPDLNEIGFRTQSGKFFKYGNLAKEVFVMKFVQEHAEEIGEALIFKGLLDEDLEIKLKGKTLVCRVDMRVNDDLIRVLWKNLPEKRDSKPKEDKIDTPKKQQ